MFVWDVSLCSSKVRSYVQIFAVSTSEREITKDPHKQVMYQSFLNLEGASGVSTHKYKSAQVDYMQNIY